ncbi:coiled-coil domain-containing protein 169-like isoform X2 [Ptychodera flava]|uniref:coiled-coil domain-containing protein 169-like isoform X2 n=1 Tax=Ptychodera flava TaxID=63121 RepID=UPI00396A9BB6
MCFRNMTILRHMNDKLLATKGQPRMLNRHRRYNYEGRRMAVGDMNDEEYDLERLRAEIQQERQMKEMLDQSTAELRITVAELEKRLDGVEEEGNEWKTRYETQEELNQQLEKQILMFREKVDQAKLMAKEGRNSEMKTYDELSEGSLKKLIRQLEKEKASIESQLRDYEWRLDQESKAFHKANDERKTYLTEIGQAQKDHHDHELTISLNIPQQLQAMRVKHNDAKFNLEEIKKRNALAGVSDPISGAAASPRSLHNVPDNQRILDPRKGPIKKTAAVKQLPKLQ